ncbi:MAG: WG repeat-containing protein, partial [Clostridiales bacterium]|nr:WG repeat-containing protein [Clostridiales bacterium]
MKLKKIVSTLLLVMLLVTSIPVKAEAATYTSKYIGNNIGLGSHFMGGMANAYVMRSGGYYDSAFITKNGTIFERMPNGMHFYDIKVDGSYYINFTSWDTTDGRDYVKYGNIKNGTGPVLLTNNARNPWVTNNGEFDEPVGNEYTLMQHDEGYPFPNYLYNDKGQRVLDIPIDGLIDRGNLWLEAVYNDGYDSIFVNRETWETAEAPSGRYDNAGGIGAKVLKKGTEYNNMDTQYGIYDENGKLVFKCEGYINDLNDFVWEDGYCIVASVDKYDRTVYGIIDTKGKEVIPVTYARIALPENGIIRAAKYGEGGTYFQNDFEWGMMDMDENEIVPFKYGYIGPFKNGIAPYRDLYSRMDGGYIDMEGNEIVSGCYYHTDINMLGEDNVYVDNGSDLPYYDYAHGNNKYCLKDKNGNVLTKRLYSYISPFYEGLAMVYIDTDRILNNQYIYDIGFIDVNGKEVIPCGDFNGPFPRGDGDMKHLVFVEGTTILSKGNASYLVYNPLVTNGISVPKNKATVMVDGELVAVDAYNVNGNNYFKLRDIAMMLDGSEKQFNVVWNQSKKSVEIATGEGYVPVGGELVSDGKARNTAKISTPLVYCDGSLINEYTEYSYLPTECLKAYNIDGNNYFKLRDL